MAEKLTKVPTAALRAQGLIGDAKIDVYLASRDGGPPVLYHRSSLGLDKLDIDRIEQSGVGFLFVRNEDFLQCESEIEERLEQILAGDDIDSASKAVVSHAAGTGAVERLLQAAGDSESIARAGNVVDAMVSGMLVDPALAGHLLNMAGHRKSIASHMMIVSALAVALGNEIYGRADEPLLRCLGIAGLLHDLGKLSIPQHILTKTGTLTRAELNLLQQHPVESVRLIERDPNVSALARQIILQHHERPDGRGYPLGVEADELLEGSKILAVVDSFHAMLSRTTGGRRSSPADINRVMMTQAGRQFDETVLEAWCALCERRGVPPSPLISPDPDDLEEVDARTVVRDEHKPVSSLPSVLDRRPARHRIRGKAMARCVHVGQLSGGRGDKQQFEAQMFDLSKTGACVIVQEPLYNGEVINVRIVIGRTRTWIRSRVAWCRQFGESSYRVGMQFLSRIPEEESHRIVDVHPIPGAIDLRDVDGAEFGEVDEMDAGAVAFDLQSTEASNGSAGECTEIHERAPKSPAGRAADDQCKKKSQASPAVEDSPTAAEAAKNGDRVKGKLGKSGAETARAQVAAVAGTGSRDFATQQRAVALAMSTDHHVRREVIGLLTRLNSTCTREALASLVRDPNPEVRAEALIAVGPMRIREAIPTLRELLGGENVSEALHAAEALGMMDDPAGLNRAAEVLMTDVPENRLAARVVGEIIGHRFSANREGVKAARRYLDAKGLLSTR